MLRNKLTWALALSVMFCLVSTSAHADFTMKIKKVCDLPWVTPFQIGIQKMDEPVSWMEVECEETKTMQLSAGTYSITEDLESMPAAVYLESIVCRDGMTQIPYGPDQMVMTDGQTWTCEVWNKQRVVPSVSGPAAVILAGLLGLGLLGYIRARRIASPL